MIEDIRIDNVDIPDIRVYQPPSWTTNPSSIFAAPPVTQEVGVPIVDMPGCVEAHEQNTSREKSGVLNDDDPKGVKVYCDAGVPSFNPMDYNSNKLKFERETPVPPVSPPPETPEVPKSEIPKETAKTVNCPTPAQEAKEPVGTFVEGFRKKVVEYKLIGKECVQITEAVPLPKQIVAGLPSGGQVVQVGGVAVIATTSALLAKPLADLLLKAVKPTVKKVIKKIAKLRGKKVKIESLGERRGQQRIRNKAIRILKGRE
jgi:hypothetical protein